MKKRDAQVRKQIKKATKNFHAVYFFYYNMNKSTQYRRQKRLAKPFTPCFNCAALEIPSIPVNRTSNHFALCYFIGKQLIIFIYCLYTREGINYKKAEQKH